MPPTFRAIFRGPRHYDHTFLKDVDSEELCLFCRESYYDSSCRAMRLSHCGHTVGFECFRIWIQRQPNTCPYYSHSLPRCRTSASGVQDMIERALLFVLSVRWSDFIEDFTCAILMEDPQKKDYTERFECLQSLADHRMTFKDARVILSTYALGGLIIAAVLDFVFIALLCHG
jgi:hypothetical protein